MRPQLLGFIMGKGSNNKPVVTGVRLCDLDNILRKEDIGSWTIVCPQMFTEALINTQSITISQDGIPSSVLMDASVESVIKQLKSGLKIVGLKYNEHSTSGTYRGLVGDIASLDNYPFILNGITHNDKEIWLDYKVTFDNSNSSIEGLSITFDGQISPIICQIDEAPTIKEYANVYRVTSTKILHYIFISKQAIVDANKELKMKGAKSSFKEALSLVAKKIASEYSNSFGFHGASLEEFRYIENRYITAIGGVEQITRVEAMETLGSMLASKDTEMRDLVTGKIVFPYTNIQKLYLPEYPLSLQFNLTPKNSIQKIVGSDRYPVIFENQLMCTEGKLVPDLKEIEIYHSTNLYGILNIWTQSVEEYSSILPKLTLHSRVRYISKCFIHLDLTDYTSDGVLDLSKTCITEITHSFNYISGVKKVIFPPTLEEMKFSFLNCPDLEELDFSQCSHPNLKGDASNCPSLTRVILSPKITSIVNSFNDCKRLKDVDFSQNTSLSISDSFNNTAIEKLNLNLLEKSLIDSSFLGNCSLAEISIKNIDELTITGSFLNCDSLTKLCLPNATYIRRSFHSLTSLTELELPRNVKEIANSFFHLKIKTLTIPEIIDTIHRCFSYSEIETVMDSIDRSAIDFNFYSSTIEKYIVLNQKWPGNRRLCDARFVDFNAGADFCHFCYSLPDSVEFLILPEATKEIHYANLCTGNYLRAVYIPKEATFDQKRGKVNLGSKIDGGTIVLTTKDSQLLSFFKRRGIKYQFVSGQEEAREIIEKMYEERIAELKHLQFQSNKLKMVGVNGELLDPKFVKNYRAIQQVSMELDKALDTSEILPLGQENVRLATSRKAFGFFNLFSGEGYIEPNKYTEEYVSSLNTDVYDTGAVYPAFRAILHLFTHLDRRTDALYKIGYNNIYAPKIDHQPCFYYVDASGHHHADGTGFYTTSLEQSSIQELNPLYLKYNTIQEVIFTESNKILLVCPVRGYLSNLGALTILDLSKSSAAKMLKPKDSINNNISVDQAVTLNFVELGKEVSKKFIFSLFHECILIGIRYMKSGCFSGVYYSLKNGMVFIADTESFNSFFSQRENQANAQLNTLDKLDVGKLLITDVYSSLDDFKKNNIERYNEVREYLIPSSYYESAKWLYDVILSKGGASYSKVYDKVEESYEYILARYLVSSGIKSLEYLNAVTVDNLLSSHLFAPKNIRAKTLEANFSSCSITLGDGSILTQYEYLIGNSINSGMNVPELPIKAPYFITLNAPREKGSGKIIQGYCSCLPLIRVKNPYTHIKNTIFEILLDLGTQQPGKPVEFLDDGNYSTKDFAIVYSQDLVYTYDHIVIVINRSTGIPFIGLYKSGRIYLLFRIKSLEISYSSWSSLVNKTAEEVASLESGLIYKSTVVTKDLILRGLILNGASRNELINYDCDYLDIIATQEKQP